MAAAVTGVCAYTPIRCLWDINQSQSSVVGYCCNCGAKHSGGYFCHHWPQILGDRFSYRCVQCLIGPIFFSSVCPLSDWTNIFFLDCPYYSQPTQFSPCFLGRWRKILFAFKFWNIFSYCVFKCQNVFPIIHSSWFFCTWIWRTD